jgi:hypothetical protein
VTVKNDLGAILPGSTVHTNNAGGDSDWCKYTDGTSIAENSTAVGQYICNRQVELTADANGQVSFLNLNGTYMQVYASARAGGYTFISDTLGFRPPVDSDLEVIFR